MNKNLHNTDDFFKSAYEQFEDEPSPAVWEKLNAALDKKDREPDRRRFIWWRRAALLLFILLAGFVLFDGDLLKPGKSHSNNKLLSKESAGSSENNTYKKEIFPGGPIINSTDGNGTNKKPESNKLFRTLFSDYTPDELFNNIEKNKRGNFLSGSDNQPDFPEYTTEINRWLLPPAYLTDNTSKNLSGLRQKLFPAIPDTSLKITINKKSNSEYLFSPYWQLTAFASYDRVGYKLDSDDPVTISNIKHNEVHEPSFSGGILATRQFTNHWGLQTGLIYSYTGIGISPQKVYAFQDPAGDIAFKYITSSGYAYIKPGFGPPPAFGDSLTVESKHQLKSINIPLSVKYRMGKNKLTVTPGAGIEAGFITSAKAEVELTDASNHERAFINKLSGTKKFYWSAIAGVELQYKVNKKTSITIQPVYRHALSPITENNVVETFPRSFGVRAGLTFRF